jgi:sugar/nucleoside kinase (ribokinase family)
MTEPAGFRTVDERWYSRRQIQASGTDGGNSVRVYDFLTIGNYTKDTIVSKAGTRQVDGGGFRYSAHAGALAGLRVAAVTRLAAADSGSLDALRAAGVEVHVFESPQSTLMRLEYPSDDVDQRILSVAALAEPFTTAQLEPLEARAILVSGSVRGETDLAVMQLLRSKAQLLAADVQGFIREVGEGGVLKYTPWPEQSAILPLLDILKTDAVEAEFLTGTVDIREAARILAGLGPREIVLTHRDGLLVRAGGETFEAGFHPRELRGRSGRGDTCVGSYLARRLSAGPAAATVWAAAVTSIKLEREGPVRCRPDEVNELIRRRYS